MFFLLTTVNFSVSLYSTETPPDLFTNLYENRISWQSAFPIGPRWFHSHSLDPVNLAACEPDQVVFKGNLRMRSVINSQTMRQTCLLIQPFRQLIAAAAESPKPAIPVCITYFPPLSLVKVHVCASVCVYVQNIKGAL